MRPITLLLCPLFLLSESFHVQGEAPICSQEKVLTKLEIENLEFQLPDAVRLRIELAKLQLPELVESEKDAGVPVSGNDIRTEPKYWLKVYRSWDDVTFLIDNLHMGLWVREEGKWKCVVMNLEVHKTFGGMGPTLPVRYLGGGLFAVSETVPGEVRETTEDRIPQAKAVTFLIDSKDCKIKERTEAFVYDHNPRVMVPKEWVERYQLRKFDQPELHESAPKKLDKE